MIAGEVTYFAQHATVDIEGFFRLVCFWDETAQREDQFLTRNTALPSETIAAIRHER